MAQPFVFGQPPTHYISHESPKYYLNPQFYFRAPPPPVPQFVLQNNYFSQYNTSTQRRWSQAGPSSSTFRPVQGTSLIVRASERRVLTGAQLPQQPRTLRPRPRPRRRRCMSCAPHPSSRLCRSHITRPPSCSSTSPMTTRTFRIHRMCRAHINANARMTMKTTTRTVLARYSSSRSPRPMRSGARSCQSAAAAGTPPPPPRRHTPCSRSRQYRPSFHPCTPGTRYADDRFPSRLCAHRVCNAKRRSPSQHRK